MKRILSVAMLGLLLAGLWSCEWAEVAEETSTAVPQETTEAEVIALSENPWGVTIEHIDLEKPENKKYIDWAKKDYAERSLVSNNSKEPEYFDIEVYVKPEGPGYKPWVYEAEPDLWFNDWEDEENRILREKRRPWNETKELVLRYVHEYGYDGYSELLFRDRATGETKRIDTGYIGGDQFVDFEVFIISDTRFLYQKWDARFGHGSHYLYDLKIGESICVRDGNLCDLGDERYLWGDGKTRGMEKISALYVIDMRKLEAGSKDAKRTLVHWGDDYSGAIQHLSSDKRFVHVNLHRFSDLTIHRGVYDITTGEQVAFFMLPLHTHFPAYNYALINDDLEYVGFARWDTYHFFIVHYDMEPTT